jgi:hypothetical protein
MCRLKLGDGMYGVYLQRQTYDTMAAGNPLLDERKDDSELVALTWEEELG